MARSNWRATLAILLLVPACGGTPANLDQLWGDLEGKLTKAVGILDRYASASDPTFFQKLNVFKKDRGDLAEDLEQVLEDVIRILDVSELRSLKEKINDDQVKVAGITAKIAELRFDTAMAAPERQKEINQSLAREQKKLEETEQRISAGKAALIEAFRKEGIELGEAEVDALVYSITGDDDIQLFTVYDNIRKITEKLRSATVSSGESLEVSRRYFGMHVLLLRAMLVLQTGYVDRIEERYIPRLQGIVAENETLIRDADALARRTAAEDRRQVEANRKAAELTKDTALLYIRYLEKNQERVRESIRQVETKHEVALHTYRTVSAAYDLVALMNESDKFFSSLGSLQVPNLLVFENSEVREKFRELSERMARG